MAYSKVYYDEIWELTSKAADRSDTLVKRLGGTSKSIKAFNENYTFKGNAALSMKNYFDQVHQVALSTLITILNAYAVKARMYYKGYYSSVDTGDGSEFGLRYTTIVFSEVGENQSLHNKLKSISQSAQTIASDAKYVKNSIAHLTGISASPRLSQFQNEINNTIRIATQLSQRVLSYERSKSNDFAEIDRLITQVERIIDSQLGKNRVPVIAYQSGQIRDMCDIQQLQDDLTAVNDNIEKIVNSEAYKDAYNISVNRDAMLEEEAKAGREWVKWIAVGVAVIGAVALTVVTVGGASPLVCAAVGAGVGLAGATADKMADNYIESGNALYNKDGAFILEDKDFYKKAISGAVVGGISGALGAVSQGSAIKQPLEKALFSMSESVVKEGAKGVVNIGVDIVGDIGEAVITGKPGNELWSVLSEDISKDVKDMGKNVFSKGAGGFVEGYVEQTFGINTGDKSYLQRVGEKVATSALSTTAEETVGTVIEIGDAVLDPHSSKNVSSILKEHGRDLYKNIGQKAGEAVVSETFSGSSGIKNKVGNVIVNSTKDTVGDVAGKVTGGVAGRTFDYAFDNGDGSKIVDAKTIWKEDLDKGKGVVQSAGENFAKTSIKKGFEGRKTVNEMKKLDHDHDGKVTMRQFGDVAVTEEDYQAAKRNAGHGAYKDKTVNDILGLDKDTDWKNGGKVVEHDVNKITKYSDGRKTTDTVTIDGKYTVKADEYETAKKVAGKGDYKGKTVNEVLGVPKDANTKNVKYNTRVDNDDVGKGKKVELYSENKGQTSKYHISSIDNKTRNHRADVKGIESKYEAKIEAVEDQKKAMREQRKIDLSNAPSSQKDSIRAEYKEKLDSATQQQRDLKQTMEEKINKSNEKFEKKKQNK